MQPDRGKRNPRSNTGTSFSTKLSLSYDEISAEKQRSARSHSRGLSRSELSKSYAKLNQSKWGGPQGYEDLSTAVAQLYTNKGLSSQFDRERLPYLNQNKTDGKMIEFYKSSTNVLDTRPKLPAVDAPSSSFKECQSRVIELPRSRDIFDQYLAKYSQENVSKASVIEQSRVSLYPKLASLAPSQPLANKDGQPKVQRKISKSENLQTAFSTHTSTRYSALTGTGWTVTISCGEGESSAFFDLPLHLARISGTIKHMLRACAPFKEGRTGKLCFKSIEHEVMSEVVAYLYAVQDGESELFKPDMEFTLQLMDASLYLDLPELVEICAEQAARNFQLIDDLGDLPFALVRELARRLTVGDLTLLERMLPMENRHFNTSSCWSRLFLSILNSESNLGPYQDLAMSSLRGVCVEAWLERKLKTLLDLYDIATVECNSIYDRIMDVLSTEGFRVKHLIFNVTKPSSIPIDMPLAILGLCKNLTHLSIKLDINPKNSSISYENMILISATITKLALASGVQVQMTTNKFIEAYQIFSEIECQLTTIPHDIQHSHEPSNVNMSKELIMSLERGFDLRGAPTKFTKDRKRIVVPGSHDDCPACKLKASLNENDIASDALDGETSSHSQMDIKKGSIHLTLTEFEYPGEHRVSSLLPLRSIEIINAVHRRPENLDLTHLPPTIISIALKRAHLSTHFMLPRHIQTLQLVNVMPEDTTENLRLSKFLAASIVNCPALRDLDISQNVFTSSALTAIIESFGKLFIRSLNISGVDLTANLAMLLERLRSVGTLVSLNVSSCKLLPRALISVISSVGPSLECLNLSNNFVDATVAVAIGNMFCSTNRLEELHVQGTDYGPEMGDDGFKAICAGILRSQTKSRIRFLDASNQRISLTGLESLGSLLKSQTHHPSSTFVMRRNMITRNDLDIFDQLVPRSPCIIDLEDCYLSGCEKRLSMFAEKGLYIRLGLKQKETAEIICTEVRPDDISVIQDCND